MFRRLLSLASPVAAVVSSSCHPHHIEPPRPQPTRVDPSPDAVVRVPLAADCSCRSGRAGEIASALCRVYGTNARASASFEMTFRNGESDRIAGTSHGTVTYARSDRVVKVYYSGKTISTRSLPAERELARVFAFLGTPICRDHAIRALNPTNFSYEGGELVEAVSGDHRLLYYIRRDGGTVHAISAKWVDGTKTRFWFGDWSFENRSTER